MKEFILQVENLMHRRQSQVTLTMTEPGGETISRIVEWEDAHVTAHELLAEAFKSPFKGLYKKPVVGETEAKLLRDLERYSGA